MRPLDLAVCAAGLVLALPAARAADDAAFRHRAAIAIEQPAAFVQVPLPPSAYARTVQPALADLRIVDANGQRVPFAVLAPRPDELERSEQQREAALYPLPPKPASGPWPAPVDIRVQGDRISVVTRSTAQSPAARSGGWLIDLGERAKDAPLPHAVRLRWSGPAEFSAAFSLDTSDDLRQWRPGGAGQVMALASSGGALTQPLVMLPPGAGRFVRLAWIDAAAAPAITGAQALTQVANSRVLERPTELTFAPAPEPPGKTAPDAAAAATTARSLHFDLEAALPLQKIDLDLGAGTRVVPARVQGRQKADEPWRELAATVFYRVERASGASVAPPLALHTAVRYLRVVPDARAAPLPGTTQLRVQARLASLVFAQQGQPPFTLLAGARSTEPSALPLTTLVPALDEERARFGRATLQPWTEVATVAQAEQAQLERARWRPVLLWAVLVAAVLALGVMVWRMARAAS